MTTRIKLVTAYTAQDLEGDINHYIASLGDQVSVVSVTVFRGALQASTVEDRGGLTPYEAWIVYTVPRG
jgi:hypothetical protein